jgi:hypothetical protein
VCAGANIIGANITDVEGELAMTCQGVGAIDLGADTPGICKTHVRGVGAKIYGAGPLYSEPPASRAIFFKLRR